MGLVLTTAAALVVWIVLWAFGVSGFDAFLVVPILILIALMISTVRSSFAHRTAPAPMTVTNPYERDETSESASLTTRVLVIAIGLIAVGFGVWIWAVAITSDLSGRLSDVGSPLLGGAIVAFAIFLLEREFEARAERQRRQFEERAERLNVRLMIGVQQNLRGIDLTGLELSRSSFNDKDLTRATFGRTTLAHAAFFGSTLVEARFIEADLTKAVFSGADLAGAEFTGSDLTAAVFTTVRNVDKADFKLAYYRGKDRPVFDEGELPTGIRQAP
jgi:hypothetical protein